jgi:hypothetical protein
MIRKRIVTPPRDRVGFCALDYNLWFCAHGDQVTFTLGLS